MKIYIKWLGFVLIFSVFSTGISANGGQCKEDRKKFCGDIKPGEGRIYECLVQHLNELSPDCKNRIEKAKKRWDEFQSACGSDLQKHCPDVKPGKGKIRSCLAKNKKDLSETCKNYLKDKKDKENLNNVPNLEENLNKVE